MISKTGKFRACEEITQLHLSFFLFVRSLKSMFLLYSKKNKANWRRKAYV